MEITAVDKEKYKALQIRDAVRVFAPATVANMVCGFDILGFALDRPGDEVLMRHSDAAGVRITTITGDNGRLPYDAALNTVSASVTAFLRHLGREDLGIEIELHKQMPIGSGLGSSAASTVAGLYAANLLLGEPVQRKELLPFALLGEELACGHGHADNVAPSLLGGITLIRSYDLLEVLSLPVPEDLHVSLIFPHVDVPTRDARKMIKDHVRLQDAVVQWGNIAGLISGLYTADYELIGRSMVDNLIEPIRSILIPEFEEMKTRALRLGALTFGISGSGPAVFALSKNQDIAGDIASELASHLHRHGVSCNAYVSGINAVGPYEL